MTLGPLLNKGGGQVVGFLLLVFGAEFEGLEYQLLLLLLEKKVSFSLTSLVEDDT